MQKAYSLREFTTTTEKYERNQAIKKIKHNQGSDKKCRNLKLNFGIDMKNWERKSLGEVCEIVNGSTPLRTNKDFWENGEFPWFTIDDIREQGRIITNTKQKVTKAALLKLRVLPIDTVLLCCTASVGEYAITKIELTTNQQFNGLVVKDRKKLDPEFLMHYCSTLKDKLLGLSGKTTIDFIAISKLKPLEIPVPPLPEQQRIVSILDECFAAIEKAKTNAEQNLKNAKELFESYLQGVFENGNWETKTLNQISENLDSKRIPITKNQRKSGDIPYYGASGIVDNVADFIFDEDLLCVSEDGANLLARTYPIAFSISGKTWVNNHAHVLRFPNITTQKFVEVYINSIKIDDYVSGMAQPKLNQAMLNKIPIPLPSLKDQQTIVRQLDALRAETQKLEAVYQKKIADLEELKKSILQKAFAGELTSSVSVSASVAKVITLQKVNGISATDLQAGITALALQKHIEKNQQHSFHHVKAEKIIHLSEYILNIDLERNPVKDAAGPNDFTHAKKVESRARKSRILFCI